MDGRMDGHEFEKLSSALQAIRHSVTGGGELSPGTLSVSRQTCASVCLFDHTRDGLRLKHPHGCSTRVDARNVKRE